MSRKEFPAIPVVEWSPTSVRAWLQQDGRVIVADSLAELKPNLGGVSEVVIAMSRRSSFVRTTRLPDASKSEVGQILALQVGTLFPVVPNEVSTDFYFAANKNPEGRLAVVAAVMNDTLKTLAADLASNGLRARAIVPAALGSALLARELGISECAIVESVPEGLAIDIIADSEIRVSRVTPMPPDFMLEPEIGRSFAMAKVSCLDTLATGGLSFPEATQTFSESSLSRLATGELGINLELSDIKENRERARGNRIKRASALLWVAVALLGAVIWDQRSTEMAVLQKGASRWNKRIANLETAKKQASAKLSSLQKVDTVLDLGFEPKQRLADVSKVITGLVPEGVWLTGFSLERGKPAQIRGTGMTGEAVTTYLDRLSSQSRFRDVKLVFANSGQIEKTAVVQFSISAHVVGNFPLDSEATKK